jgi:hypothetical protein
MTKERLCSLPRASSNEALGPNTATAVGRRGRGAAIVAQVDWAAPTIQSRMAGEAHSICPWAS